MALTGKRPPLWVTVAFDFHSSPTLRKILLYAVLAGLYTWFLDYLENFVLHVAFKPPSVVFTLMGTVLGLLLVFRTNTAYDRWWSGRILLSDLMNSNRAMAIKLNAYLPVNDVRNRKFFAQMMSNHAFAMKENLRHGIHWDELEEVEPEIIVRLKKCYHVPNEIISIVNERITELYRAGVFADPHVLELTRHTDNASNVNGSCERIRTSPMPFSYNVHLKKFMIFFVAICPFGFIHELNHWSILIVGLVVYALAGLDAIGEEIEDPFGQDENDLPIDKICKQNTILKL
jgi:ion channel-forming bestrophin family protein